MEGDCQKIIDIDLKVPLCNTKDNIQEPHVMLMSSYTTVIMCREHTYKSCLSNPHVPQAQYKPRDQ